MKTTISVFCIWRDNEDCIDRTLSQLESLATLDQFEFSYFFYENDSKDKTLNKLEDWMSDKSGLLQTEKLGSKKFSSDASPERMSLLCECRNKCKSLAGENKSDYSLLIDSDIIFKKEHLLTAVKDLKELENAAMITSNNRCDIEDHVFHETEDCYYDAYPFRDRYGNIAMYMTDCPSYLQDDKERWSKGEPIITMSSFGGFALIKSKIFNKVSWSSHTECDHVNMCYDISRHGIIYCDPKINVRVEVGYESLNYNRCQVVGKQQLDYYKKHFKEKSNS